MSSTHDECACTLLDYLCDSPSNLSWFSFFLSPFTREHVTFTRIQSRHDQYTRDNTLKPQQIAIESTIDLHIPNDILTVIHAFIHGEHPQYHLLLHDLIKAEQVLYTTHTDPHSNSSSTEEHEEEEQEEKNKKKKNTSWHCCCDRSLYVLPLIFGMIESLCVFAIILKQFLHTLEGFVNRSSQCYVSHHHHHQLHNNGGKSHESDRNVSCMMLSFINRYVLDHVSFVTLRLVLFAFLSVHLCCLGYVIWKCYQYSHTVVLVRRYLKKRYLPHILNS